MAERVLGGEVPGDLWDVDSHRFAPFTANRKALAAARTADGRAGGLPWMIEEQRATREAVARYDQSSLGKLLLGRDALAVLQRMCANGIDAAPGRMVCTALLNERGGF